MLPARAKRARESVDDMAASGGDHNQKQHSHSTSAVPSLSSPIHPSPTSTATTAHSERLQAVFDWALLHGASAPKLRLGRGKYGWGVFATADIAPSEEIASIPLSLVLTHQRADDSAVGAAVRELNDRLQSSSDLRHPAVLISPRTTLYLYMLQQLADPTAFFHPYLASLSPPCSPLLWPLSSLSHLSGTNLHAAIPNKLRQLHARYDNCVPLLCESFPAVFDAAVFTSDRFLWAHTQLTSRGFPVRVGERAAEDRVTAGELRAEGSKRPNERVGCLLSLLDMTNHRMRTGITWTTTSSDDARVSFCTGSSGGVSAGSEVFNNYGAKSNEEFLLGYGFCIDDNPYDEYTVQLGGVDDDTGYMLDLLQLPWRDKGYYLTADSTPQQLMDVLRVAVMTEAEREVWGWQRAVQGTVGEVGYVNVRNEMAMLDQLHQLLMSRLTKLSHHTLQQAEVAEQHDREKLSQPRMEEDARLALVYKKGQRHILIQRIKHTQQARADILSRTPPLCCYRLSLKAEEADRQQMEQLASAWERVINPVPHPSSVALSIPSSLLITPSSISQSETFAAVLEYAAGLTAHQELTLFVLHLLQLSTESPYSPLVSFLHHPAHPSHSLPPLLDSTAEYADALDVYEQLFPALTDANSTLFSAPIHSRSNWLWAHYLVHRHTLLLPTADGRHEHTFLPVTSMPPSDVVWRGRLECDETRFTITCDADASDVRVVYDADAEDDGRSVWMRGEYVLGSHPIIRVGALSLFSDSVVGTQSSAHRALFALFMSWDDEEAEAGHFHVGDSGVCGGLLAWCRLLAMTTDEIATLMQHATALHSKQRAVAGSTIVLDTDERTDDVDVATEHSTHTSEAAQTDMAAELSTGEDVADEQDEEAEETEEAEEAEDQSSSPRRNMRRLLLTGPAMLPHLLEWCRIQTAGWQRLHSALHALIEEEAGKTATQQQVRDAREVAGVVEVSWEQLQTAHQRDRLSVLRKCVEWVRSKQTDL